MPCKSRACNAETMINNRRRHITLTPSSTLRGGKRGWGRNSSTLRGDKRKAIAAVAILLIALAACHNPSPLERLGGVDSLVNARPDSALTLLNSMARDTAEMSRRDLMRYYLLRTNAENKCDTVLTARHAALMRRVCDYYDRHSSPRGGREGAMLAHYLLGRCYDDMGEAPLALEEFNHAINSAGLTPKETDLGTLGRVHGQKAYLFYKSYMPDNSLLELDKAKDIAIQTNDTLSYIMYDEQRILAYYQLHQYDSVLQISNRVSTEYMRMGRHDLSVHSMGTAIYTMIKEGQAREAYQFLVAERDILQEGSAFSQGLYNAFMGMAMLGNEKPDSAVVFFRKQLSAAHDNMSHVFGYHGLFEAYDMLGEKDSVARYARLYCSANDSSNLFSSRTTMQAIQGFYQYERDQRLIERQSMEIKVHRLSFCLVLSLFFLSLLVAWWYVSRTRNKAKNEQLRRNMEYAELLSKYKETRNDIKMLQGKLDSRTRLLHMKKSQEAKLGNKLSTYQEDEKEPKDWDVQLAVLDAPLVGALHMKASIGQQITDDEVNGLFSMMQELMPTFMSAVAQLGGSNSRKMKKHHLLVCVLLKLRFTTSELSTLFNKSMQSVSNMKQRINTNLFGKETSDLLEENLMNL